MHRLEYLPGTRRFIESIQDTLRDGKNLVIISPPSVPGAIWDIIRSSELGYWYELPSIPEEMTLPQHIIRQFAMDREAIPELGPEDIIKYEELQGKVMMAFASNSDWASWKSFIGQYQQLCKEVSPLRRCLFVIVAPRSEGKNLPREDVCLSILRWEGILQGIDLRIISEERSRIVEASWLERQLLASIGVSLSLWDIELCERLVEAGLKTLVDPFDFLIEYGKTKGLDSIENNCSDDYLYEKGARELVDGKYENHSAYLALRGDKDTIYHRIWKGQSSVLLSVIEERRHRIAHELGESWGYHIWVQTARKYSERRILNLATCGFKSNIVTFIALRDKRG